MPRQNVVGRWAPFLVLGVAVAGFQGCQKKSTVKVEVPRSGSGKPEQKPKAIKATAVPTKVVSNTTATPTVPSIPGGGTASIPAPVNQAPTVASISLQMVGEGSALTVDPVVTDENGIADSLSFSCLSGCPAGSTLASTTGRFQWAPSYAQAGGYRIVIGVSDGVLVTPFSFEVSVIEVNATPTMTSASISLSPAAPQTGDTLTCTASYSDADGTVPVPTFSFFNGATLRASTTKSAGTFFATYVLNPIPATGAHDVAGDAMTCNVSITDGVHVVAASSLPLSVANKAPTLSCTSSLGAFGAAVPTTPCTAFDADGQTLTHSISGCGLSVNASTGAISGTYPSESCTATMSVSDGTASTPASFQIAPLITLRWANTAQLDETCRISVPGESVAVTGQSVQSSTGSLSLSSSVVANSQGLTGTLTGFSPGPLTATWNVTSVAGHTTTLQKTMTLSASTALLRPLRAPDPFVDATADVSPGREVERGGTCQNCTTGLRGSVAVAVDSRSGKSSFVCALASDGTVKCWGSNPLGGVGNGAMGNVNTPAPVNLGVGVTAKALAAGGNHACAILSTGDVKCWGEDYHGQVGTGTATTSSPFAQLTPASVNLGVGRTARSLALGDAFSCAILDNGTVKCWGYGWEGQLGNGAFTESASPVAVSLPASSVAVGLAAGGSTTCALLSSDKVYCWGTNYFGQLGTGSVITASPWGNHTPQEVTPLSGASTVSLSVGALSACALKSDGSVRCWGRNAEGETGSGVPSLTSPWAMLTPTPVVGLDRRAVSVSVGRRSTCAVLADGEVKCWGHYQNGALGYSNGSYGMLYGPSSPVRDVTSALAVSVGNDMACALHADSPSNASVKCWGSGASGELGNGTFAVTGALIPVTVGSVSPAFRTGCQAYALSNSGALAASEFIEVEPTRVVADVSQFPVGINTNYLADNDANRASGARGLGSALEDLGVKFMRFPEGETADTYLWSVPPYTSPQPMLARVGNNVWPSMDRVLFGVDGVTPVRPLLGFDQFMSLATARGAAPILTVAFDSMYPSATAPTTRPSKQTLIDTAREWVRYSNVTQGYNVKYWELGNETHLSTHDAGMATAATYATDFVAFATEMKSVDSTIKLGANGSSGSWFDTLLLQAGASIDWLAVHTYPAAGNWTSYANYSEHNESMTHEYDAALSSLARTGPSEYARIGIGLTEYNAATFDGAWADTNDLGHALVAFEILGQHLKRPRLLFTQQWATRWINDFYTPARAVRSSFDALDTANQLTPTGRGVAIWGKHLRRNVVFSSNGPAVRSYASAGSPDGVVSVFLVNKSLSTKKTTVRVKGFVPGAPAHVWTLSGTGPSDTAPVWMAAADAAFVGEHVTLDLAPSSITVLEAAP